MAISRVKRGKRLQVVTPEAPKAVKTDAEMPKTPFDLAPGEPDNTPPARKRGRPEKKSFWDNVNSISPEEWQAKRCYIYAYLSEPFCNVKVEGEPGYLRKFYQPIDPEFFLNEWGSGKYFLRLKEKRPGEKTDRDIDTLVFEIYNPSFPPKLPRKLWENDPRNARWLSMLPKEEKVASQAETMQILNAMFDMQDRIEERIKGDQEAPQSANSVLDTAARLIELTKPKENGNGTPIDPWAAAERILNMRSDNPMVTILNEELKALRQSLDSEREGRLLMQQQIFDAKLDTLKAQMQPTAASKSLVDQIKDLAAVKNEIAGLLGINVGNDGTAAAPIARGRSNPILDFAREVLPEVLKSPLMNAAASALMAKFGPQGGIQPPIQQNGAPQQQLPPEQDLIQFVQRSLLDPLVEYLQNGDGTMFAEFVYNGWPERLRPMQHMTHPQMPGQEGPPVIVELFKHSDIWATKLAHREMQFRDFVLQFCRWSPDGEQPAPQTASTAAPVGPGVTDLDAEEGGEQINREQRP